jgi:Na+-driven multidrug efflux pump
MLEQIYAGVGMNKPTMVFDAGNAWLLQVPAIFISTKLLNLDQTAVWWTFMASAAITSIFFYIYYRRGQWLEAEV